MKIKCTNCLLFILLHLWQSLVNALGTPPLSKCAFEDSLCLTTQARAALQSFTDGIPELGVDKLDTMDLEEIALQGDGVNYKTYNTKVKGLKNSTIDSISINTRLNIITLLFNTTLYFDTDYEVNGSFLSVPLNGQGKAAMIKKNLQFNIVIVYDIEKKNGKNFMHFKKHFYGVITSGMIYSYSNLLNKDKVFDEKLNEFANANWIIIYYNYTKVYFDHIVNRIVRAIETYMTANALEDIAII